MRVLGIETSCDETGVAVYDATLGLLAHHTYTQTDIHAAFGGVVPELASRDHLRKILPLIQQSLAEAQVAAHELNGIAYTKGPGLVGALLVGAMVGRALAYAWQIPAIGIHHLEGHLLAPFLEVKVPTFPFLALLVSGGHTELVKVYQVGEYEVIGDTLDDAAGEAFDKIAKLLGLGYPGGAKLAALAQYGQPKQFNFPKPMLDRPGLDFSFSGLKTHVAQTIKAQSSLTDQIKADIAYAFEEAVVTTLMLKCERALQATGFKQLIVAGGVGANQRLRQQLEKMALRYEVQTFFPRQLFCTDNGAMIAYAGCQRLLRGESEALSVEVHPRWPLASS